MKIQELAKVVNFYGRLMPTYSRIGYHARAITWPQQRPFDFSGQHWLVTGASQGIGKSVVHDVARAGGSVIAVARSEERLRSMLDELPPESAARVTLRAQDLALQSGVAEFVKWLIADGRPIDVLVNNVGLLLNAHALTAEGREMSYAANLLGHYQLTEALFQSDLLAAQAIIVNMSSGGLYNVPLSLAGLNITDPGTYNGKAAYAYAKRAQVALADYWDERIRPRGGRSYVMHPGWAKTPGVKASLPVFWKIQNLILRPPYQGADTALWLARQRPESGPETVWFDRAPRTAHLHEHTRKAQCTTQELVRFLEADLEARG